MNQHIKELIKIQQLQTIEAELAISKIEDNLPTTSKVPFTWWLTNIWSIIQLIIKIINDYKAANKELETRKFNLLNSGKIPEVLAKEIQTQT